MCIWLPDRLESKGGWVGRPIGRQTDVWMRAWSPNGWVDRVWMELVDGWGECQAQMELKSGWVGRPGGWADRLGVKPSGVGYRCE